LEFGGQWRVKGAKGVRGVKGRAAGKLATNL